MDPVTGRDRSLFPSEGRPSRGLKKLVNSFLVGGFFPPIWKICAFVKLDHFPIINRDDKLKNVSNHHSVSYSPFKNRILFRVCLFHDWESPIECTGGTVNQCCKLWDGLINILEYKSKVFHMSILKVPA